MLYFYCTFKKFSSTVWKFKNCYFSSDGLQATVIKQCISLHVPQNHVTVNRDANKSKAFNVCKKQVVCAANSMALTRFLLNGPERNIQTLNSDLLRHHSVARNRNSQQSFNNSSQGYKAGKHYILRSWWRLQIAPWKWLNTCLPFITFKKTTTWEE